MGDLRRAQGLVAALMSLAACCVCVQAAFNTVKDVSKSMYREIQYSGGWYKLLNESAEFGSQNVVTGQQAKAVLMDAADVSSWPLSEPRVLVASMATYEALLVRLTDAANAVNVVGVLVDPTGGAAQLSSAATFPGAFNTPYSSPSYKWNPAGSGLARAHVTFPVIMMTLEYAADISSSAAQNKAQEFQGAVFVAQLNMDMQATTNATHCLLTEQACKPLGGFSVWSAMPPLAPLYPSTTTAEIPTGLGALTAPNGLPQTVVVAQIDSDSLFHDYTQASESPLSGLIAMMAAMEIIQKSGAAPAYVRQLVFMAIAGEPWDYMGSRRLMFEMHYNTSSVNGLNMSLIDQVVELGTLGRGYNSATNASTMYMHAQETSTGYGNTSALMAALQTAAADTTEAKVFMNSASPANPGIPPSSLMSFLRTKASIAGVVLTDFDSQIGKYYRSELDNATHVDSQPIVAAAIVTARALHALAAAPGAAPLSIDINSVTATVLELAGCLMVNGQPPSNSLRCDLVTSYIQVGYGDQNAAGVLQPFPWRYIGIVAPDVPNPTNITYKREIFSFVWNWMANTSASAYDAATACDPFVNLCSAGKVCVGWHSGQVAADSSATMGRCATSTTKFAQATSTRIAYTNETTMLLLEEPTEFEAKYSWPIDPLWMESDWTPSSPYVRVYQQESSSVQVAILVSGILLTVATAAAAWVMSKMFEKKMN